MPSVTGRRGLAAALGACALLTASAAQPAAAQSIQPLPISPNVPDLSVSMAATPTQVGGGKELTFTSTVRNIARVAFYDRTGTPVYFSAPASGIVLTQTLPAGTTFRSATANMGFTCANVGSSVTCTGGSLQAAESATITVKVTAPLNPASLTSTIVVDPTNAISERDETNNSANASASVPLPELSVRLYADDAQVDDQAWTGYQVYVDNAPNAADARGVSFRLTLPQGTRFSSASDGVVSWLSRIYLAGFACSESAGVVTCSGGHIAPGETGAASISVVAPFTNGPVTANVVVDPTNAIAEQNETNNTASATYTVYGRPDLSIRTNIPLLPPPPLVARVTTIQNSGAGTATNVEVTIDAAGFDPPPAPAGSDPFVSVFTDSGFTCTRGNIWPLDLYEFGDRFRCTGGTIAPGGTATITTYHVLAYNSPYRQTSADVDPSNRIRESNETNNHAAAGRDVW